MKPALAEVDSALTAGENLHNDPQLISDLFHALNQPITALQCALELSLRQSRSVAQYRDTLQTGLQQVERIASWATRIRELLQAHDAGDERQVLPLQSFLQEAVSDLQPVAESLQVRMALHGDISGGVLFERRRLRQALFSVLEYALSSNAPFDALEIDVCERHGQVMVLLASSLVDASPNNGHASPRDADVETPASTLTLQQRLGLAIPRRILEAAGGSLKIRDSQAGLRIELCFPLVTAPDKPSDAPLAMRLGNSGVETGAQQ
jgi:two-component system heavy metal sensor histidine kinase CusS